jgi:hypothetical protein
MIECTITLRLDYGREELLRIKGLDTLYQHLERAGQKGTLRQKQTKLTESRKRCKVHNKNHYGALECNASVSRGR